MEKPENNEKHEILAITIDADILANPEKYSPKSIIDSYNKNIAKLHQELYEVEKYLKAKEISPKVAAELSDLLTTRPVSGTIVAEKNSDLEYYERIIHFFEESGAPKEIYRNAKLTVQDLKNDIAELAKVATVAKETPGLN